MAMSYAPETAAGVTDKTPMDDSDLLRIIENFEQGSLGRDTGDLSQQRAKAFDYYLGQPFGDEIEGRSQVVSTDVYDAVEGMLPSLLDTFASSDRAVEFTPQGMEDEAQAKEITEAVNYVFYRQNNGFLLLYTWFKDALIQKNGIVKFYYEKSTRKTRETYKGLTEQQMMMLVQDAAVSIIGHEAYPDPSFGEQQAMMAQAVAQATGQPLPPPPMLHDVELEITDVYGKVCVENVPPEEFMITSGHTSLSLQDCEYCAHRKRMTVSELRDMGHEVDPADMAYESPDPFDSPEETARHAVLNDANFHMDDPIDESMRSVWVTEAYLRVDYDGDGIAELRQVLRAGKRILQNEEVEYIPFAAITPNILPHQFFGLSIYDVVGDIQYQKSALKRQMFDNLYLANMPRLIVQSSPSGMPKANLDDLLTARPGGIIRAYEPNAVTPIETRFVAAQSFPMLEYMDGERENRLGVTRYNQGTDADSLNKTAHGISQIMNAGQQKLRLVARIFAETGVKDLFRGIMHCLAKYSMKPMMMRLNNQFTSVDPRAWKTQYDMVVNVGLGTGDKTMQLQQLGAIMEVQKLFAAAGKSNLVNDKNLYNAAAQIVENSGLKHVEAYFTDPAKAPPPPPAPPPPEIVKIQAEAQEAQQQRQAEAQMTVFKEQAAQRTEAMRAEMERFTAQLEAQTQKEIAAMEIASKERIAQMQVRANAELEIFKANNQATIAGAEMDRDRERQGADLATREREAGVPAIAEKTNKAIEEIVKAATNTQGLEQAVKEISKNVAAVDQKLRLVTTSKESQKVRKRTGTFNGKPFQVTDEVA